MPCVPVAHAHVVSWEDAQHSSCKTICELVHQKQAVLTGDIRVEGFDYTGYVCRYKYSSNSGVESGYGVGFQVPNLSPACRVHAEPEGVRADEECLCV